MVNMRRLTQHAQRAKGMIDEQGGTDALKEKAQRMKSAAQGGGSMGDKAKAAAAIAREKPNPASPTAGDEVTAAPTVTATPTPAPEPTTAPASVPDPAASAPGETASEPVENVPDEQTEPPKTPPAPEPDDAKPNPDGPDDSGTSEAR